VSLYKSRLVHVLSCGVLRLPFIRYCFEFCQLQSPNSRAAMHFDIDRS
jgi:hypothetical protein